jgi:hypothetical protein
MWNDTPQLKFSKMNQLSQAYVILITEEMLKYKLPWNWPYGRTLQYP